MKIHHLEYTDGGILDPDDVLADVVEDKDKVDASKMFFISFTKQHILKPLVFLTNSCVSCY